jgi:hypothetical protein
MSLPGVQFQGAIKSTLTGVRTTRAQPARAIAGFWAGLPVSKVARLIIRSASVQYCKGAVSWQEQLMMELWTMTASTLLMH